jgi:hypothetical protein
MSQLADAPLQPGQRVIVCLNEAASGATLGYYGTVKGIRTPLSFRTRLAPEHWVYRVWVPFYGGEINARAIDLFATGEIDASWSPEGEQRPLGEVRFDDESACSEQITTGMVRLEERDWCRFVFTCGNRDRDRYELRMPAWARKVRRCELRYEAAAQAALDRSFVLTALAELLPSFEMRVG